MGCCTKIKHELLHASMYDLCDPTISTIESRDAVRDAALGNKTTTMDVEKTFAPTPHLLFVGAKFVFAIWLLASMIIGILNSEPYYGFWFAYLSNWGLALTVVYFMCSFVSAALLAYYRPLELKKDELTGKIGVLLKITWALFALTFPAELIITVLFWTLVFNGRLGYSIFITHGIALVIIGIDGILINRTPMRMKQFIFFEMFAVLYTVWSVLQSLLNVGNPWKDEGDNEPIYGFVDWKDDPGFASGLILGLLFIANPIAFLLCRALSRALPMRCCTNDVSEAFNDEEMLEVPAREPEQQNEVNRET